MNEINYYSECNESLAAISRGLQHQRGINKSASSHMSLLPTNFFSTPLSWLTWQVAVAKVVPSASSAFCYHERGFICRTGACSAWTINRGRHCVRVDAMTLSDLSAIGADSRKPGEISISTKINKSLEQIHNDWSSNFSIYANSVKISLLCKTVFKVLLPLPCSSSSFGNVERTKLCTTQKNLISIDLIKIYISYNSSRSLFIFWIVPTISFPIFFDASATCLLIRSMPSSTTLAVFL